MRNYDYHYSRYNRQPRPSFRGDPHSHGRHDRMQLPDVDSWRDSNDYRKEYFKRNHGFAGMLYICSQCVKPMINKSKIQVDHIIPPSRFVKRRVKRNHVKNTNIRSRLLNNTFNCAAICRPCNQRKSNKMGLWVARGIASKTIEVGVGLAQLGVVLGFSLTLTLAPLPFKLLGQLMRGKNRRHNRYCY